MKVMIRKIAAFALIIVSGALVSCELFEEATNTPLTEAEIVEGLKEALDIGLDNAVSEASSTDGYLQNEVIKILLPTEVQEFQTKINNSAVVAPAYSVYVNSFNGGNDLFDELIVAMNRGAETAAAEAGSIFLNAILSMTFDDARAILDGGETAATDYFYATTNQALFSAFQPEVKSALDQTGASGVYDLTYDFLAYDPTNLGLTTVGEVLDVTLEPSLDEYATNKAIDGLFYLIGEEEKKIRDNPFAWGSSIIERVFGNR